MQAGYEKPNQLWSGSLQYLRQFCSSPEVSLHWKYTLTWRFGGQEKLYPASPLWRGKSDSSTVYPVLTGRKNEGFTLNFMQSPSLLLFQAAFLVYLYTTGMLNRKSDIAVTYELNNLQYTYFQVTKSWWNTFISHIKKDEKNIEALLLSVILNTKKNNNKSWSLTFCL